MWFAIGANCGLYRIGAVVCQFCFMGVFSINTDVVLPRTIVGVGDSDAGVTDIDVGDSRINVGDADSVVGDLRINVGDSDSVVGDSDIGVGDCNSGARHSNSWVFAINLDVFWASSTALAKATVSTRVRRLHRRGRAG